MRIMLPLLPVHIAAGGLAIVLGGVALVASKGAAVHRRSGLLFVYAMLTMGISGSILALRQSLTNANVLGGLMACYFVITALTTVRPASRWTRRLNIGALVVAVALSLVQIGMGSKALASPSGMLNGVPFFMLFFLAAVTTLAAAGDVRVMRAGALRAGPRLARHLWRMCFALFIAAGSFFSIQARVAKVLPEPFTTPVMRALPVALVFVAMFYWLWRVRTRRVLPSRSPIRKWMLGGTSAVVLFALGVQRSPAQSPLPSPAFEVATIKPTDPAFGGILIRLAGGRFSATGFTLQDLIAFAYAVDKSQITGGPNWFASNRYDVLGKPEKEGSLHRDTARIMLRGLLTDRFQLKFHLETREMPVYVLTVGKTGAKMKPRTEGDGGETTRLTFQGAKATGRNVSARVLAEELQAMVLDRPVLDKTGLTGNFDFYLSWRPEAGDPNDPDIFTAIQEQLGLKLEARREAAKVIGVDRAMKPSGN